MGKNYLIDTNIISKYFQNQLSSEGAKLIRSINTDNLFISVINRIEILAWNTPHPSVEANLHSFLVMVTEISINESIIQRTISLRKKTKVKLPDAMIAATAIEYNLILLSDNDKDFLKIPQLKYKNPLKM